MNGTKAAMVGGGDGGCSLAKGAKTAETGVGAEMGRSSAKKEKLDEFVELVRSNLVMRDVFGLYACGGLRSGRP